MTSRNDDNCTENAIYRANRYYESALLHYLLVLDITMKKRLHRGNCHSGAV